MNVCRDNACVVSTRVLILVIVDVTREYIIELRKAGATVVLILVLVDVNREYNKQLLMPCRQ